MWDIHKFCFRVGSLRYAPELTGSKEGRDLAAAQHFRGHRTGRRVFTGHSGSPGTTTGGLGWQLE